MCICIYMYIYIYETRCSDSFVTFSNPPKRMQCSSFFILNHIAQHRCTVLSPTAVPLPNCRCGGSVTVCLVAVRPPSRPTRLTSISSAACQRGSRRSRAAAGVVVRKWFDIVCLFLTLLFVPRVAGGEGRRLHRPRQLHDRQSHRVQEETVSVSFFGSSQSAFTMS